jgi:hypothetical protein
MSGARNSSPRHRRTPQAGAAAVEFALVVLIFLTLVFGIIEMARLVYVINTLYVVTQRAAQDAAKTDVQNEHRKDEIRQNAIFRTSAGMLAVADPVTEAHVRIDYMSLKLNGDSSFTPEPVSFVDLPANPANNRVTCLSNPHDARCVRLVRVRICDPADTGQCKPVRYRPIAHLIDLPLDLPFATTIVMAETLGYTEGMVPVP